MNNLMEVARGVMSVPLSLRKNWQPLLLACFLIVPIPGLASPPIYQSSFHKNSQDWTAVRGSATLDTSAMRENSPSLRVERVAGSEDASIRLAPVKLTLGKAYELTGWVRTESLEVRDLDRSPIATGATLTMASMPFDVHSESVGGTRPWTRVGLRFIASRAEDQILLTAGNGGSFSGKAWFEGIQLDEAPAKGDWPAREAVQTYGPAYRYPAAGWIYLHIEGQPYERGYQHGHLMAREIPEYLERCAAQLGDKNHWSTYRTSADALFLRGFDQEILEEMRGIADGASDAGARWQDRRIDLTDIVVANVTVEMGELNSAVTVTPSGLEGLNLGKPDYAERKNLDHCSSFAATGPATRDGKMVIGHVTWWPLNLAEQTNVWLDIKPASGHRVLIQSYPGGIESGTDWYQNDAGVVLTETTINQTPFNIHGTPVAYRARMAAQYSASIDDVVRYLDTKNNGLYTNEWIIGDAKTDEITIYDLGTNHTRLWRSSRNEWFGSTPGFYWGDNNAKDLSVRLENYPDPHGEPDYIPYTDGPRDLAWQQLYRKYFGKIDEQFGFLAFRTPPLVSSTTMDAKITTSDMASHLMVWGAIGKPNQIERVPQKWDSPKDDGLYPSGYYLFKAEPTEALRAAIQANERERLSAALEPTARKVADDPDPPSYENRLWNGWILPASDADNWFVAGSAVYRYVLASKDPEESLKAEQALWRGFDLNPDTPANHFRREQTKGVLLLDALRHKMGDDRFFKLMKGYFNANTTRTVTAKSFLAMAGVGEDPIDPPDGTAYLTNEINRRLSSAVIVYGTMREAGANRYAAEQLQSRFLDRYESQAPIYKDFEATDDLLRHRDVVFVGRPEANSALAQFYDKLGLKYEGAVFTIDGVAHASEREGLILAAQNPLDGAHMVLVVAGNSALSTVKTQMANLTPDEYLIVRDGGSPIAGFIQHGTTVASNTGHK